MTSFETLIARRRSCRRFRSQTVDQASQHLLLRAALMSPTSKNQRAWSFVVTDSAERIALLAEAKETGAHFLRTAPLVIAVLGNGQKNDCWIEDGTIAAFAMQLQGEDLGLGSCWVQIRDRQKHDGESADAYVRQVLNITDDRHVLCLLAFGYPAEVLNAKDERKLRWDQVNEIH